MIQPHLLDRGFRSHPRNPKHFTLPLPSYNIKRWRRREALPAAWALGRESTIRAGEHWVFPPGMTHRGCGGTGRPWRCSITRFCADAQPQAHPGSKLREAARSARNAEAIVVWISASWICSEQLSASAQHNQCRKNRGLGALQHETWIWANPGRMVNTRRCIFISEPMSPPV